jgi:hypothetical protein
MSDSSRRSGRRPGDPAEESSGLRGRIEAIIPPLLRRTVETAQATEDALRTMVGDNIRLPKEAMSYIVEVADTTKREVVRVAAREFREFLESANLTEEIARILTTLSFEIRTEIRFVPNDQALRPNVRSQVRMKATDAPETAADPGAQDPERAPGGRLVDTFDDLIRVAATEVTERLLGRRREAESEPSSGPSSVAPLRPSAPGAPRSASSAAPRTPSPPAAGPPSTRESSSASPPGRASGPGPATPAAPPPITPRPSPATAARQARARAAEGGSAGARGGAKAPKRTGGEGKE